MNETQKMHITIFDYIDYRKYLHDYYSFMKSTTTFFSHRYFMNRAEIKSPNFLKNVMEGKKNLTKESVLKFAKALGLKKKEIEYFENMVFFDQSTSGEKKQYYYDRMMLFCKNVVRATLKQGQAGYFSQWYHCIVRELVVIRNYQDNWAALAADVRPKITPVQARKSVELLVALGLIGKNSDGTYSQTSKNITAGTQPLDIMVIRNYHRQALKNAQEALDAFPSDERNLSALIMSVSESSYREIVDEIQEFRDRVTLLANKTNSSDRVYKLAIQLFPVSSVNQRK